MEQELYELPKRWEWKKLGSVVKFKNGYAFKSKDFEPSGIPVLRISNIQSGRITLKKMAYFPENLVTDKLSNFFVEKNDVVIAMSGATTGKVAINDSDQRLLQNQRVGRFVINDPILRRYIYFYLKAKAVENLQKSLGAAQPNLSTTQINNSKIPLPPLNEQKQIVAKLDALFTRIDTAISHLQETLELSKALFASALDEKFDQLFKLYETKKLKEIAKIISGYAFKSSDFSDIPGVRSVKITNVGLKYFVRTEGNYLPREFFEKYSQVTVNKDDIVIALTRSVINGGLKVCRVPTTYHGALVNQRVAAITKNNKRILLDFIYWYLNTTISLNYILDKSRSLNQPNLSIKDLINLKLPYPPIEVQLRTTTGLATFSERINTLEAATKEKIENLTSLKASLLDQTFRGQLLP